jgi:hypothetical protein
MLLVPGAYPEVLRTLFQCGEDGRLVFGSARGVIAVSSLEVLADWVEFRDYIMEGHVRYDLRARPDPRGLLLDIRLKGDVRDKHVESFVARYVGWTGLRCERV